MIKPRSAKAKGTRLEKAVQMALQEAGAEARKQPGSGIYSAFPADVFAVLPVVGPILIECKSHKSPLATIRKWLGKATVLVHKADGEEALVTVPLSHYCQMVRALSDTTRPAGPTHE
jgi:Holliday junction resolvase